MAGQALPFRLRRTAGTSEYHRSEQGFTLVELIVTLLILGILAAIIVPRYSIIIDSVLHVSASTAATEASTRLHGATQLYTVTTGKPPKALSDIAGSQYLSLSGDNTVSVGSYQAAFAQDTGAGTVTISITNLGGTAVLANATIPWP